ncbi:MAG: family 16 glycosylhydrolase [Bacteroidales bacterium]
MPYILFILLSIFLLTPGCFRETPPEPYPDNPNTGEKVLVWSDEFNINGLPDASKWGYDIEGNASGWGNNESQYYTANRLKNAEVKDGFLHITAHKEDFEGFSYTSARLRSKGKGDWLYGRVEVKAKLPDGRGMWPAIWMLPTDWAYGGWPASGEIDIMENVGYDPYVIVGSAHTESYNHSIGTHKNGTINIPTCYSDFHVYALEWEVNEYRVYVDDRLFFTFKNEGTGYKVWPFDKRFHLLLNVAVGGNWGGVMGIDDTIFPRTMVVDYVRVYQKK